MEQLKSTGSIAQDALRLGFQTTCHKGVAKLLKVDDATTQACQSFKNKQEIKVNKILKTFEKDYEKIFENEFMYSLTNAYYYPSNILKHIWYRLSMNKVPRKYSVKIKTVRPAKLNLNEGKWKTAIEYEKTSFAWSGLFKGKKCIFKKEIATELKNINTYAKVCKVKYIPYSDYYQRYIPDEAVYAVKEAMNINMTKILVAQPKFVDSIEPMPDPIIVGHIGDQMFIIAWFGYNKKDPMACNI